MARVDKPSDTQNDYIEVTDTVSRPLAAVFTVLIVFVGAALAFSLFLGGRWLYQHLDGTNQPKVTVVENPITVTTPTAASTKAGDEQTTTNGGTAEVTKPAPATVAVTSTQTTPSPTSTAAPTQIVTTIPDTGPTQTFGLFIGVFLISTVAYQLLLRKRNQ